MGNRHKDKCNRLREVRVAIAKELGIEDKIRKEECKFNGECKGTCPACEADEKILEEAILSSTSKQIDKIREISEEIFERISRSKSRELNSIESNKKEGAEKMSKEKTMKQLLKINETYQNDVRKFLDEITSATCELQNEVKAILNNDMKEMLDRSNDELYPKSFDPLNERVRVSTESFENLDKAYQKYMNLVQNRLSVIREAKLTQETQVNVELLNFREEESKYDAGNDYFNEKDDWDGGLERGHFNNDMEGGLDYYPPEGDDWDGLMGDIERDYFNDDLEGEVCADTEGEAYENTEDNYDLNTEHSEEALNRIGALKAPNMYNTLGMVVPPEMPRNADATDNESIVSKVKSVFKKEDK